MRIFKRGWMGCRLYSLVEQHASGSDSDRGLFIITTHRKALAVPTLQCSLQQPQLQGLGPHVVEKHFPENILPISREAS